MTTAQRDWFADSGHGDLRLARGDLPAIDTGVLIPKTNGDSGPSPTFSGSAPDAGAFEYRGTRP